MKEIYCDLKNMFSVFEDELQKQFYIEVTCGDVGLYDVRVPLTAEEVLQFKKDPNNLLGLVREITYSPQKYEKERNQTAS